MFLLPLVQGIKVWCKCYIRTVPNLSTSKFVYYLKLLCNVF